MHTNPYQVGITGGIGAGKSMVAKVFALLGIPVYDADSRAKWLMAHDEALRIALIDAFGKDTYLPGGALNRRHLAQQVFANGEQVKRLNALVHPRVAADGQEWALAHGNEAPYVLREAALLFESGSYQRLDSTITVFAPIAVRVERVLARDPQRTAEEVRHIIDKQWPESKRQALAHHVVDNGGAQLVLPQIMTLHAQFVAAAHKKTQTL